MTAIEQTHAVEINETRISYSEIGKGEPVLFLHGTPGSRRDFSAIIEKKSDEKFRFLIPDRPGHMSSDEIIDDTANPWADVEIFAHFIDQKCDGKAWLAGYSMGAYIACKLAIRFPEKVKGILMFAPYIKPDNPNEKPSAIPGLAKGALIGTFLGITMPMLAQNKMQQHIEKAFSPVQPPAEFVETWLPRFTRFETLLAVMTDKNAMLNTLTEVQEKLKEIKCPLHAIFGEKDRICSVENQKNILKENLPKSHFESVAEGGHAILMTHADECLNFIYKSLEKA